MVTVILRLREWRERRGLSQSNLASRAGTHQKTISNLETGSTQRIELDLLGRLSRALNVLPHDLFGVTPEPERKATVSNQLVDAIDNAYDLACEEAEEVAKELADEAAKEAATEMAKDAYDEAYDEVYADVYKETYEEEYKTAFDEAYREAKENFAAGDV